MVVFPLSPLPWHCCLGRKRSGTVEVNQRAPTRLNKSTTLAARFTQVAPCHDQRRRLSASKTWGGEKASHVSPAAEFLTPTPQLGRRAVARRARARAERSRCRTHPGGEGPRV